MSTPEQQLEAAKVLLSDAVAYLEDQEDEPAIQLQERIDAFLEESQ